MDIDEAIKGRRSIRKFKEREVPDSVIREVLEHALHAPSSMNGQPWRFLIIRNKGIKKRLVALKNNRCPIEKAMYRADFIEAASAIIVVCVDKRSSYEREIENGVLAAAHIMLSAYAKGLATVYMSAQRAGDPSLCKDMKQLLRLPGHVDPITIIPIGYPDETPEAKPVVALDDVIFYDGFNHGRQKNDGEA